MSELSVQLYTVRDALAQDFDGTLSKLAAFGFTQVEPFAFINFADELRSGLPNNGLTAPTAHVHLIVGADGHEPLITQLFIDTSDYLDNDVASAVKPELIVHPEPTADDDLAFTYDFALAPARTPAIA